MASAWLACRVAAPVNLATQGTICAATTARWSLFTSSERLSSGA
jgi:hypothetical protein